MVAERILVEVLALYGAALGAVLLLARLRLSPIVALILTGVVCGPFGIGLVGSSQEVEVLAELGVVLLLFTVGLDFPVSELRRIWKTAVLGGMLQVGGTTLVVALAVLALTEATPVVALFVGVFAAMSSTAIVIRGLGERNELHAPHGQFSVGVLLLQDLAIVVIMALVPAIAGAADATALPGTIARLALALAVVAVMGRLALPALLRAAIRSRRREAFTLALLLASVGTAWVCTRLGLPTAVGAFLGGLVLAESEFSAQAQADIRPIRDLLTSLFFVSVGMLLDVWALSEHWPLVVGLSALLMLGKATAAAVALLVLRVPLRVAVAAGLVLAQVGEFSLILGEAGADAGVIQAGTWQLLLSVSLLTMLATPPLVASAPSVAASLTRWLTPRSGDVERPSSERADHVIILGYGLGGRIIAQALRSSGRPHTIIDLNGVTVARARAAGEPIMYGDATNPATLTAAGLERAEAVVSVLNDADATRRAVLAVRTRNKTVPVIARTRYRLEAERLLAVGATAVLVEEIETSLEVLARLLLHLGLPGDLVEALRDALRGELAEASD